MKTVRFHPEAEAEAEMIDVAVWYESQQATLGKRFVTTTNNKEAWLDFDPCYMGLSDNRKKRAKRYMECVMQSVKAIDKLHKTLLVCCHDSSKCKKNN